MYSKPAVLLDTKTTTITAIRAHKNKTRYMYKYTKPQTISKTFSFSLFLFVFLNDRFNPYDRAPLNTLPLSQIQDFYVAYDRLSQIIADSANEFWILLTPGRVVFIDNWRVMHGRAAFTGPRTLCGCYLQRDEWVSKARVMGLF